MRSTINLRWILTVYVLGITWCLSMVGTSVAVAGPLTSTGGSPVADAPLAVVLLTFAIAAAFATSVTGALWYVLRRLVRARGTVAERA